MQNNTVKTVRLNKDGYVKKQESYQETLKEEDIIKLLEDYIEVDNDEISKIPLHTHLRYFVIKDTPNGQQKLFRMGGLLSNKDNCEEYIILSNGKNSWSVQIKNSIIYRKMTVDEIKENLNNIILEKDNTIKKYKKEIKRLRDVLTQHNISYK